MWHIINWNILQLQQMNLLEQRISRDEFPNKFFFVYANTVATIDFVKKFKGHGFNCNYSL